MDIETRPDDKMEVDNNVSNTRWMLYYTNALTNGGCASNQRGSAIELCELTSDDLKTSWGGVVLSGDFYNRGLQHGRHYKNEILVSIVYYTHKEYGCLP